MTKATTTTAIAAAADALRDAYRTGVPCQPIRHVLGVDDDVATGYAVQRVLRDEWCAAGRRIVGHKIGLTARAVQTQLGVDQPDYGTLFADAAVLDGEEVPHARLLQPRVEAEVAFVMDRDLAVEQPTVADVLRATAFVLPAIEIVDSRIANWDITIVDTLGDNAAAGLFVLGTSAKKVHDVELRDAVMAMHRGDEVVSRGVGSACLGSPANAVAWLASALASQGTLLREGDVVLSGALGPMVSCEPGDRFEAHIEGLGSVAVSFSPAAMAAT